MAHDWPGNVRELRNVLERGAVVATGPVIQLSDLGLPTKARAPPRGPARSRRSRRSRSGTSPRCSAHTGGNVSQSARILGIDRVTLYNKMKKWGLRRDGEEAEAVPEGERNARGSARPPRAERCDVDGASSSPIPPRSRPS